MDRREFLAHSLAASGSVLLAKSARALPLPQQVPGAVPSSEITNARFPNFSRRLGFVSGHRFSGAANAQNPSPL
jgi:hypothetical protein